MARHHLGRRDLLRRGQRRALRCEQLEDRRLLAVITVDTVADTIDFADGVTSLREAVFAANTVPGADQIVFEPTALPISRVLTLQLGELLITDPLTITGPSPSPVGNGLLRLDGRNESRIINFSSGGELTLSRLVLDHGRVTVDNAADDPFSTLGSGGALRATTAGLVTLNDVIVANSVTTGAHADGGGVFVAGSLVVTNGRFLNNRAEGADAEGGSIAVRGPVTMQDTLVSRSRASRGGGVAAFNTLELIASTLNDNTAFDNELGAGGGLYAVGFSASLINSTISGNAAQVTGTNGRAQGGGVFATGILTIAHNTIASNTASSLGVGAEAAGGGVYAGGRLTARHAIVAGNFSTEGDAEVHAEGSVLFRYSLLADNQGTPLAEAPVARPDANGNLIGGATYGLIDPLIAPLAYNGGPSFALTHALKYGSPAISAGDPAARPGQNAVPWLDQRGSGFPRQHGARIDMGAVENSLPVWVVDTLLDENDEDYSAGDLSLREAVRLANASPGAGVIEFSPALYAAGPATILLTQREITITGAIDIRGPGAGKVTIDASGSDPTPLVKNGDGSRIFAINDTSSGLLTPMYISGLTLRGGDAKGDGGAIQSADILTLTDVRLAGNASNSRGGAVASPQLTLVACEVDGNVAAAGAVFALQYLTVERSAITDNHGTQGAGGVFAQTSFDTIISQSVISNNTSATTVGGLRIEGGRVSILETLIANNRGVIGGMHVLTISGSFEMWHSSVVNNTGGAETGGIQLQAPGSALIEQSTISGNRSTGGTGGISSGMSLAVRNSTIANNITETGAVGGISNPVATQSLFHSIVAGNLRRLTTPSDLRHPTYNIRFSLIGSNGSTLLVEAPVGSPDANGNLIGGPVHRAIDPKLGPLADNGGAPTLSGGAKLLTHAPLAGSPAIDAGDSALMSGVGETPVFDQRGAPRVVGARIDIGAVEAIGAPIVVDTLVDESDGDYRHGDLSLREAIELANTQPGAETIVFDPALFANGPGTILLTGGQLEITQSLALTGPGSSQLIVDASGNDPTPYVAKRDGTRVFSMTSSSATVELRGMTITGGDSRASGGGVVSAGDLVLSDCVVVQNRATGGGGGVYAAKKLVVHDSTIEGNSVVGGPAVPVGGGLWATELLIERSRVIGNSAGGGGGAFTRQLQARDSIIADNVAGEGGGAWASFVEMTGVLVERNTATHFGRGGGLFATGIESVTIVNSTFASNQAGDRGGAIYSNSPTQPMLLLHSTISGNSAGLVGGVRGGEITVRHSSIVANENREAANAFVMASGIFGRAVTLEHSIVAANRGQSALEVQGLVEARSSLIGNGVGTTLPEAPVGFPDANGNLVGGPLHGPIDPLLGPLSDNGGPSLPGGAKLLTRSPLLGSPVVDVGSALLLPGLAGVPEFDQRGAPYSRLTGSRVDIGAVELQAAGGALSGDFNLDGRVDGSDFLAWQRGVGRMGVVTIRHGDATADGDVDGSDLAVWKARAVEGGLRGQESGVNQRGGEGDDRVVAEGSTLFELANGVNPSPSPSLRGRGNQSRDAVFAAGDFSGLFDVNGASSSGRPKWRPARRG